MYESLRTPRSATLRAAHALAILTILFLGSILPAATFAAGDDASSADKVPLFFTGSPNEGTFRTDCDAELKAAQASLDRMLAVKDKRTVENTLVPYNEILYHADNAASWSSLMQNVHPDSSYRAAAEEVSQAASKFTTQLGLNRAVYDAIQAVDVSKADAATKRLVEKSLRDFRLAGVDKDEATRKQIEAIQAELVLVSQEFDRNIRSDSKTIQVAPAELDGLPADYIAAHPAGPDGKITISIEYPDRIPVMRYAKSSDVRRRLQTAALNRAYPANMAVIDSLAAKRYRLARLLGYPTWADYITADKMIGTSKRAADFTERIGKLVRAAADKEYAAALTLKKQEDPKATEVPWWDGRYYELAIKKRDYDFDAQAARPYFAFDKVKQGLLDVTSTIFGVTYTRIQSPDVWHPSVEAYEVRDGGRLIGRFFLDLHPRAGKYNHAAAFQLRNGVEGVQLPQATLVCNFAGGTPGDPGLMEYQDVETFFHEFGHLMHGIFGGHQRWMALSGISTEWDFVEAPSQMLEEWCRDEKVLQTFAKHYQTGEPIPSEMVRKMRRASVFGRGIDTGFQVFLSQLSLNVYNRDPKTVNTDAMVAQYLKANIPYPPVPDTHIQASFGHLDGYSAIYYTYLWSLVIAKDLFSQFDRANLLDPTTAMRYRKTILEQGGVKPAEQLAHDFLKRDFNYKAYEAYVKGEN